MIEIFLVRKQTGRIRRFSQTSKKILCWASMDRRENKLSISLNESRKIIEEQRNHSAAYSPSIMRSFRPQGRDGKYYSH